MTDLRDLHFGVEIETVGASRSRMTMAIHGVVGGTIQSNQSYGGTVRDPQGRIWCVKSDGSLTAGDNGEITTPPLNYCDIDLLQRVVRALRHVGARVDSSCGLHIHLDAALFDGTALVNLTKLVYANESYIMQALAVADRRRNTFCKPCNEVVINAIKAVNPVTKEQFRQVWAGHTAVTPQRFQAGHDHGDRYHGLNMSALSAHGTVEFRYFNGSVHAGMIKACIQLVLALGAYALNARRVNGDKKIYNERSAKYDFRCVMIRLGMNGPEFATAREHLLKLLPGTAERKTR